MFIKGTRIVVPIPQKDWTLEEDTDFHLTSTLIWEIDRDYKDLLPVLGSVHPYHPSLYAYRRRSVHTKLNKVACTLDYIGIEQDPTPPLIEFPGGTGEKPIDQHERFDQFAGDADNPLNGAQFDPETEEVLNFTSGNKRGTRSYLSGEHIVHLSYWTFWVPDSRRLCREIVNDLPGVIKPDTVENYLLIGLPYRQVGPLYQVTEQWKGSGENGWDTDIYGS